MNCKATDDLILLSCQSGMALDSSPWIGLSTRRHAVRLRAWPSLLSIVAIDTKTHSDVGRKWLISSYCLKAIRKRSQVRDCRGTLPTGLLPWACSYNSGPFAQGRYHPQRAGPFCISHSSRRCLTDLPTSQSDGSDFWIEISSSQVNLVCVKLTKT